ncbi:MAG: TIR domain-containing protein, partial [Methanoregula sp.]
MAGSFAYDIFLSYSSKDKLLVCRLAERLKEAGLRVWFDKWSIKPGDDIFLAIEGGLEASRVQVLCLSPAALGSDWVKLERSTVLFRDQTNADRRFVPLLLADCTLPGTLQRYKYVDFRQETQEAFDELVVACRDEAETAASMAQEEPKRKPESVTDDDTVKIMDSESGECQATTSIEAEDITASGKPDVYIQDRKYSSIQEAVNAGNPGETITLVAGTYRENLRIDKSFIIKGAGVEKTIIDGWASGSVIIVGWNRANIDVTLTGITVTGGTGTKDRIDPSQTPYVCGGGIFNKGRLNIKDCVISGNAAYCGGGIFNKGTLNLEKGASVNHNTAHNGGGIYGNIEKIILDGGTVSSNEAEQLGGGIYIDYRGSITVHSGTISNNAAKNMGGGIYSQGGPVTLHEGTIFSNDAVASGGGIYCGGSANQLNGGSIHSNT